MGNPQLIWQVGTAYDMILSLHVLYEPERYGLRGAWAAGVRSRLPAEEREFFQRNSAFLWPLDFLHELPLPQDGAVLLATLAALPVRERLPVNLSSLSQMGRVSSLESGSCSNPSARSACVSSFSPRFSDSVCASVLRWLRILERARPVRTKPSHAGLGFAWGVVMISTTSPFLSSVRSGTCSLLILAALVRLPTLLWMA